jgi:hypothetical protein
MSSKLLQDLMGQARFYKNRGASLLCRAEMCDPESPARKYYLKRAFVALDTSRSYYETAYHCAADIYGENNEDQEDAD